jgi:hypothetical protein
LKPEDFDNVPYMALKGVYTPTCEVCQTTVDQINARRAAGQGAAKAEYIKLDELKNPVLKGTTHMMMLGTNHLDIADVILNWADENIPPKKVEGCGVITDTTRIRLKRPSWINRISACNCGRAPSGLGREPVI